MRVLSDISNNLTMSSENKKGNQMQCDAMIILRKENESDLIEVTVKRNVKAEEEEEEGGEGNTRGGAVGVIYIQSNFNAPHTLSCLFHRKGSERSQHKHGMALSHLQMRDHSCCLDDSYRKQCPSVF